MFRTRRSRFLVLLGLTAVAGAIWARSRRRAAPAARLVEHPDAVASEPVTTDPDAVIETTAETAGATADDTADETVNARIYEAQPLPPPELDEPDTIEAATVEPEPIVPELDLDRIGRDLDGVEQALRRLDDGTYWTDEITGEPLDDALLIADPVARRNAA